MYWKHSQVNVGPVKLHVVELGKGKPVLFVMGSPISGSAAGARWEAVAAKGYRAIAVDMRGYGRSSAVDNAHGYTAFDTVGDLVKLLGTLQIGTVALTGTRHLGAGTMVHI